MQRLSLLDPSFAFQVRKIVPPHAPGGATLSVYEMIIVPDAVQLSVAVAVPVFAGNIEAPHATEIFAGQLIIGAVLSEYPSVVVCVKLFMFGVVPVTVDDPVNTFPFTGD